jgi:hypothetical protein
MLKFSFGNSKMNKLAHFLGLAKNQVASFDLPAGFTCPAANLCLAYANRETGKITDGANSLFRCYAASLEAVFKGARLAHWHNYDLLTAAGEDMVSLLEASLPKQIKIVRIHSSGDFFNKRYFQAWVKVAENHPEVKFFGYTKVLPYVNADKPDNFRLVYSFGGKMDNQVTSEPVSYVINTPEDGGIMGLQVACQENPVDDFQLVMEGKTFALALHGTQKKGARALGV